MPARIKDSLTLPNTLTGKNCLALVKNARLFYKNNENQFNLSGLGIFYVTSIFIGGNARYFKNLHILQVFLHFPIPARGKLEFGMPFALYNLK